MVVTMLLCDAAQAVDGKLYVLGGGWSVTPTPTGPLALAVKVEVPWTDVERVHDWALELRDADGHPVVIGDSAVHVGGTLHVGRPVGLPEGTPADAVLALSFGPLPLAPGRYTWWFTLIGETETLTTLAFSALGAPAGG